MHQRPVTVEGIAFLRSIMRVERFTPRDLRCYSQLL